MRTDLDQLSVAKQRELEEVVRIVFAEFREATENATGRKNSARILKIILPGSYARDDWADVAAPWSVAEQRLNDAYLIEKRINTPVHFIVHSLQQVDQGLSRGWAFFMEIAEQGIAHYEADDRELAKPKPKTPSEAATAAQEYFDEYFLDDLRRFCGEVSHRKGAP